MKILTIISNYNEEKNIVQCIDNFIKNSSINSSLLVIDNCSKDKSIRLIKEKNINYIKHPVNTGGSVGVIKTAFLYSYMENYDIYCHIDGDNQHDPSQLKILIEPILNNNADIVIGSRFLQKKGFQSLFLRRIGIKFFSFLLSKIIKRKVSDLTSGFRAYNKKAITFFGKQYKHKFEATVEMLMIAHYANLIIEEVPVKMKPRIFGKSEIGLINSIKFPIYAIISIIGTFLHKKYIKKLTNAFIY